MEIHNQDQKDLLNTLIGETPHSVLYCTVLYCTALFPADEGYYYHWTGATDQRHEGTWLWGGETGSGGAVEDVAWMARE